MLSGENRQIKHIPFGEITLTNSLVQELEIKQDATIDRIDILMATCQRSNSNSNIIELSANDTPFYSAKINSSEIEDNSFLKISGFHKKLREGDILKILITSNDGTTGNAITAWINTQKPKGKLLRYNRLDETYTEIIGELELKCFQKITYSKYLSTRYLRLSRKYLYFISLFIILQTYYLIYYLFKNKEGNFETHHSNPML